MDKKRLTQLVLSIFVALIFISSYVAFGNINGTGSSTTTAGSIPPTVFATGYTNASVTGYNQLLQISAICGNESSLITSSNNYLAKLEANNSVSNFYSPSQAQIFVQAGNFNSLQVYTYISSRLASNQSACLSFQSDELVELPQTMPMNVQAQRITVYIPNSIRSYSLPIKLSNVTASKIPVKVIALLTQNGTIYGNLSISRV